MERGANRANHGAQQPEGGANRATCGAQPQEGPAGARGANRATRGQGRLWVPATRGRGQQGQLWDPEGGANGASCGAQPVRGANRASCGARGRGPTGPAVGPTRGRREHRPRAHPPMRVVIGPRPNVIHIDKHTARCAVVGSVRQKGSEPNISTFRLAHSHGHTHSHIFIKLLMFPPPQP